MSSATIQKIWHHLRLQLGNDKNTLFPPQLDESALEEIAFYAESLVSPLFQFPQPSAHQQLGEILSHHRGSGFEFDENRPFREGDEQRFINWRLYARTGNMYSKVFIEERRPDVQLLIDRRPNMRFGTRQQLKVDLALKITACLFFHARKSAHAIGGLLLNQTQDWFSPARDTVSSQRFIRAMSAACPPLSFDAVQPDLNEVLRILMQSLIPGGSLWFISDFADLDTDTAAPLLHHMASKHHVTAVQIVDPVELRLPLRGEFMISDKKQSEPLLINARDREQQLAYMEQVALEQRKISACFEESGIPHFICSTEENYQSCVQRMYGK